MKQHKFAYKQALTHLKYLQILISEFYATGSYETNAFYTNLNFHEFGS